MSTIDRVLDIFEAYSASRSALLLPELAEKIHAPKSTCFQITQALKRRGYLYSLGKRRGYYPTRRLLSHAEVIAKHDPIVSRLDSAMTALRDSVNETVIAGRLQANKALYLAVVESTHNIRYSTVPGDSKPLHSSAIGKSLLVKMDDPASVIRSLELAKYTDNTICDSDALLSDLRESKRRGYCVTRGENVVDVMAISLAINIGGDVVALAVAGPIDRVRSAEQDIVKNLMDIAIPLETVS